MAWGWLRLKDQARAEGPRLVAIHGHDGPAAEAFRTLRTNLLFAAGGQALRTLVVTGVGPDEGKSTVAGNLAVTLAAGGMRTLVVEADLRRPSLHRMLGVAEARHGGLTRVLAGPLPLEEAVVRIEAMDLDFLPSGPLPPNPSELLGGARMAELLATLAGRWDMVVIDTPPVVGLADAAAVAARVDGTLLVVSPGLTDRGAARAARRQLEQVGARVLGVVLNGVSLHGAHHYYYYRYGRYGTDPDSNEVPGGGKR